jgi:hypothetical protein
MRFRNARVLLAVGLVAALALPGVAGAAKGKKKDNYVQDVGAEVYGAEEVEDPYMTVWVQPHRDTGKKVKVKFYEHIGDGDYNLVEIQRASVSDDGYAYLTFEEVSDLDLCLLKIKQPASKKIKAAVFETGMDCRTGEISAG